MISVLALLAVILRKGIRMISRLNTTAMKRIFRIAVGVLVSSTCPITPSTRRFSLIRDPFEQEDLSKKNPQRLAEMVRAMTTQLDKEGALYPESKDGAPLKPVIPEPNPQSGMASVFPLSAEKD